MKAASRMSRLAVALIFPALLFVITPPDASAQQMSALIGRALDKQLSLTTVDFNGTLPQAIQNFGDMTGVRIEADNAVYDALPWGDLTTFSAKFEHQTFRQALGAICQKLGLEFEAGDNAILLRPMPALARLGRRSTVDELAELDFLRQTPLDPTELRLPASRLLAIIDATLHKTSYAIEDRSFSSGTEPMVNISRNATLADGLEEISAQTDATWYPWGNTIVVLNKPDQIRMQLSRRISTRFTGQDVSNVLLELSRQSGVLFQIEPGAIQRLPAESRIIELTLDNATIMQAMESICGYTGLNYAVTNQGVRVSLESPTTAPTTQPVVSH